MQWVHSWEGITWLVWWLSNKGKEFVTALPPQWQLSVLPVLVKTAFVTCLSLYIPAWLPWNCAGCAFMQQNPAPGCLRCATLLKNGFAAIRGTPVSQVTMAVIKLKFQWAEFQHGRSSQMPWVTARWHSPHCSVGHSGIVPEPGRAGVICIHLHMWQPLLQCCADRWKLFLHHSRKTV